MKIKVGKTYKTRGGQKAVVSGSYGSNPFGIRPTTYPFVGYTADGSSRTWTEDGVFYEDDSDSLLDLVAEWREPATEDRVVWLLQESSGDPWCYVTSLIEPRPHNAIGSTRVTVTEGVFA